MDHYDAWCLREDVEKRQLLACNSPTAGRYTHDNLSAVYSLPMLSKMEKPSVLKHSLFPNVCITPPCHAGCGFLLCSKLSVRVCVLGASVRTWIFSLPSPSPPPIPQEKGDNPCWFSPLSHRRRERIRPSFLPCPIGSIEKGEYLCWQSAYMCQREKV